MKCLKHLNNILRKIIIKYIKQIRNIIVSSYLCIKFPFLYPRNRFTDKHTVYCNWISKLSKRYYTKAYTEFTLSYKFYKLPLECTEFNNIVHLSSFTIQLINNEILKFKNLNDNSSFEFNLQNFIGKKFKITGITLSKYNVNTLIYHVHKNEVTDINYGFAFKTITICTNKLAEKILKFINWIDDYIINKICFIPTYTELDSLPLGWRKNFGIQMCKELKKTLKKENYLYKFRIFQLKEKYGHMELYPGAASEEIYDIIQKYHYISYYTCITCGKPAHYLTSGYILPYCEHCAPNGTKERQYFYNIQKFNYKIKGSTETFNYNNNGN